MTIEHTEFAGNGRGDGCNHGGCTHNFYIAAIDELQFRFNWSHRVATDTQDKGHLLKSRAQRNYILYNRLSGEDGFDRDTQARRHSPHSWGRERRARRSLMLPTRSGPSEEELRLVPEADFDNAPIIGRGDEGMRQVREYMRERAGRPAKGSTPMPSSTKSIRFPDETWAELEQHATARGTTLHALLRDLVVDFLRKAG